MIDAIIAVFAIIILASAAIVGAGRRWPLTM